MKKILTIITLFLLLSPLVAYAADVPVFAEPSGSFTVGSGINAGTPNNTPVTTVSTPDFCSNISSCITGVVYLVMVGIFGSIAYVCALFFDVAVQVALNTAAYAQSFLSLGWTQVRDIANMLFVFILLYLGWTVMLKAETVNTTRMLAMVIVMALLVNFSFFATRIVIDAGNIMAVQFYNAIPSTGSAGAITSGAGFVNNQLGNALANAQAKDLTGAIMQSLGIQTLFSTGGFQQFAQTNAALAGQSVIATSFLYIMAGIMFALLAASFLFAGAKFIMRVAGLWFLLVASPLAFVAKATPHFEEYFDRWLQLLVRYSAYPAVFLFCFWLQTIFLTKLNASNPFSVGSSADFVVTLGANVANMGIRMGFILATTYIALSAADHVVKQGATAASAFQKWGLGAITGGVAGLAGRLTLGLGGNITNRFTGGPRSEYLANRTYDPRNIPVLSTLWRGTAKELKRGGEAARAVLPQGVPLDYTRRPMKESRFAVQTRQQPQAATVGAAQNAGQQGQQGSAGAQAQGQQQGQQARPVVVQQSVRLPQRPPQPVAPPATAPAPMAPRATGIDTSATDRILKYLKEQKKNVKQMARDTSAEFSALRKQNGNGPIKDAVLKAAEQIRAGAVATKLATTEPSLPADRAARFEDRSKMVTPNNDNTTPPPPAAPAAAKPAPPKEEDYPYREAAE
ncbi:MAG: hypothetical protein KGI70_01320 [Patescibacteria group bacterium]|nr:hypothetical protein [Patescibacteria group bacterium]